MLSYPREKSIRATSFALALDFFVAVRKLVGWRKAGGAKRGFAVILFACAKSDIRFCRVILRLGRSGMSAKQTLCSRGGRAAEQRATVGSAVRLQRGSGGGDGEAIKNCVIG